MTLPSFASDGAKFCYHRSVAAFPIKVYALSGGPVRVETFTTREAAEERIEELNARDDWAAEELPARAA
ncbi:MAG TPA: hypothetical protein VIX90_17170 [Edaphobacter sp.]